ncbi:MAG: hypothetical protein R3229_03865 [Alphaproteobacteria bacterium]|nr:hypothetical protein [Alphaproteobacteria bacterium]
MPIFLCEALGRAALHEGLHKRFLGRPENGVPSRNKRDVGPIEKAGHIDLSQILIGLGTAADRVDQAHAQVQTRVWALAAGKGKAKIAEAPVNHRADAGLEAK